MDLRPSFESIQEAFGLESAATVTLPDGTVYEEVTPVWLPPLTEEIPAGSDIRRASAVLVLAIARAEVPQVPIGTIITCPSEEGGDDANWKVDAMGRVDSDHHRVIVVPA